MLDKIVFVIGMIGCAIACFGMVILLFIDLPNWLFGLAVIMMAIWLIYDETVTKKRKRKQNRRRRPN